MPYESILIRIMNAEDYKDVKSFMSEHFFTGEPLGASSGENVQKHNEEENDQYHLSMIDQGTCLIAIEGYQNERIVGIVLAGPEYPSDLDKHHREAEEMEQHCFGRICRMSSKIEMEANIFERYNISRALYSYITCVHTSMRGKCLGTRLAAALMDLGRSKGFPMMAAICTSFYSARQKEALGMQCIYSLAYADYKDEQGRIIFQPPAPHTHARFLVMKL